VSSFLIDIFVFAESREMAFTKASQLPSLIEAEQLKLEEMKQSVYDVRDSIDRQIKLYTQVKSDVTC